MTREQLDRQIELAERISRENFTRELYCRLYNVIAAELFDAHIETGRHATREEVKDLLEYFRSRFFEGGGQETDE